MRLEEGDDRADHPRHQSCAQARLGRDGDRRQPRYPHLAGLRPPRRCCRAHHAAPGRGRRVEGPGRRVEGRERRHHPRRIATFGELRQDRHGRRQDRAAGSQEHQAQGSEGLDDRGQASEAARYRGQTQRQQDLRHRRQTSRHAVRRNQGLPGVRRQAQELRRGEDRRHARRAQGGEGEGHRHRRRRRYVVAREVRARCPADRLGRGRGRKAIGRDHCRAPQGGF